MMFIESGISMWYTKNKGRMIWKLNSVTSFESQQNMLYYQQDCPKRLLRPRYTKDKDRNIAGFSSVKVRHSLPLKSKRLETFDVIPSELRRHMISV